MTTLRLYQLLQQHTGQMNELAVKLANDQLGKDEAAKLAETLLDNLKSQLRAG